MQPVLYHDDDDRRTEDLLRRAEAILSDRVHLARGEARGIMRELAGRVRRGRASVGQVDRAVVVALIALGRTDP